MKIVVTSALFTTATATILGLTLIMSVDAATYVLAMQSIGADTPISGLTVGAIIAGISVGGGGLIWCAKLVFRFGGYVKDLETTIKDAVALGKLVHDIEGRMETMEVWRASIADPSLRRSGATMKHDTLESLYRDEAAG